MSDLKADDKILKDAYGGGVGERWQYLLSDPVLVNLKIFMEGSAPLVACARNKRRKMFIDLCGGSGALAHRALSAHDRVAVSVDWKKGPIRCDLKAPGIYKVIEGWVQEGLVGEGHLHMPCETWTSARHGKPGGRTPVPLRDRSDNIWGFPDLVAKDQLKLEEGNGIARALFKYLDLFKNNSLPMGCENGDLSILWALPECRPTEDTKVLKVCYCMMGRPFRKRTRLMVWCQQGPVAWKEEAENCEQNYLCNSTGGVCKNTGRPHLVLRGWNGRKAVTEQGARYPRKFVNLIARVLCSRE